MEAERHVPRSRIMASDFMHHLGKLVFRLGGWTVVGCKPELPKYVVIAAPHTSNWDGLWFFATASILRMEVCFLGKHSLFVGPLGAFLRAMGGIPLDRSRRHNMVSQAVEWLNRSERLVVGIAPEGTRKWTPGWKTGFYHVARQAGVPIVLAFVDYEKKQVGLLPQVLCPSGDIEKDFEMLRRLYQPCVPYRADQCSPILPLPPAQGE